MIAEICSNPVFLALAGLAFGLAAASGGIVLLGLKWLRPDNHNCSVSSKHLEAMEHRLGERIDEVKDDLGKRIDRVEDRLNGYIMKRCTVEALKGG